MVNRNDVETELKAVFSERFVHLWWGIKLPGLGYATPAEVYAENPELLYNYVKSYRA